MSVIGRLASAIGYPQDISADYVCFAFKIFANRCVPQRTKEGNVG
jgi:hypothetical protein